MNGSRRTALFRSGSLNPIIYQKWDLEASHVELTVPCTAGAFFDRTRIHFCVPADSILLQPTLEASVTSS